MAHKIQSSCRICGGGLRKVLDLGNIYPSNFVDKTEGKAVPLALVECKSCGLVQLKHTVDLDEMYRTYFYQSAINPSMVKSLQDVVTDIENTIKIEDLDVLVDIGCNDGIMFSLYKNRVAYRVGYDPALNLAEKAKSYCTTFINDYFCKDTYMFNKAKVVTAIAMFYDLPDPNKFVRDVVDILADDGIFVIQFTDLLSMLKINAIDNICHEHLEYYKLSDVRNLLDKFGLDIFKVSYNKVNGGSVRVFAGRNEYYPIEGSVLQAIADERVYLDSFENPMKAFADRVSNIKKIVLDFLCRAEDAGIRLYGMGASTKGNTLLQYFGITKKLIPVIAEVNPDKFGKKTIATNIPIIAEEQAFKEYPEMFFILPWHFVEDFVIRNKKFLDDGGAFIVPLPEPVIYYLENGELKWTSLEKVLG
jgi:SAM-dependent methyltransferase